MKDNFGRWLINFGLKKYTYDFIENLTELLSAGMDMGQALESLGEEIPSRRMKIILKRVSKQVEEGIPLSKSLEKESLLSERMIALLRLGEQSGKLVDNLKVLVLQNQKDQVFRSKVRSSLMYAVIIFSLAVVIGSGAIWYVLPKLVVIFDEMGADLPLITQWLVWLGKILGEYGHFIIPGFLVFVFMAFYFLFSFPRTKFIGHSILFKLPLVKDLIRGVELARFGFLLGTMLEAGLPVTEALDAMPGTTTFRNYRKLFEFLRTQVEEGNSFQKSFRSYKGINKLIPISMQQMIFAGEKSGSLAEVLLKIGQRYEIKTEETARNLPILMEPVILLILGAGVMVLALGVIMPFYKLVEIL